MNITEEKGMSASESSYEMLTLQLQLVALQQTSPFSLLAIQPNNN